MSFDDLPDDWARLPLDTPGLAADVVDLVVGHADRMGGAVGILLTGPDRTMTQPCVIGEIGDLDPDELAPFVGQLAVLAAEAGGGLLFVRGRPGSVLLTDLDRRWHQLAIDVCRKEGVPLLGAFLATPATVRSFPVAPAEADLAS